MTNAELIGLALRQIGVISEIEAASAEQGADCLIRLNQMIEAWTDNDIDIGYFQQSSTSADCPIPQYAERAVISSLAIEVAPIYGAMVSAELAKLAIDSYSALLRKFIVEKMQPNDMTNIGLGEGYRRAWDITNG